MMMAALAAVLFGFAAWGGALLGYAYCVGKTSFDEGPPAVNVSAWVFAIAGACIGLGQGFNDASPLALSTIALVIVALAACAACDFKLGIVPDLFTLVPLAALIVSSALQHNFAPLFSAAVMALPFALIAALSRGLGMGWGDVKLVALGGALLGAREATIAFFLASALAFAFSYFRGLRGRPIAFGPYLVGGIGTVLMFSSRL